MRQAYIGEDGRIYDAEGNPADGKAKKAAAIERHRHMFQGKRQLLENKRRVRGGFFRGIGQASVDVMPSVIPASNDIAYRMAVRVAVPLAQGFTWNRLGSETNEVYPGRLVISDNYPGNLFRVAFRPATNNNEAMTRLAILVGTGAGDYIEVPIQPDGSQMPALMTNFKVVPRESYIQVDYAIQTTPVPNAPGGDWKATFQWIYTAIDQAAFLCTSFSAASTPVEWGNASKDNFVTAAAALGFIVDAIDMIGWAYDFGRIGDKELKIFTKVGTDIFVKISKIYELINPGSQASVFNSSDSDKIEAFQKKVDEMVMLRPYWSVMLARAFLYNQQTDLLSGWMAHEMYNFGISKVEDTIGRMKGLRPEILASVAGQMPEDQLSANLDALVGQYQAASDGMSQNQALFEKLWKDNVIDDASPGGMYAYSSMYDMMLEENAKFCMEVRDQIKAALSKDLPCGDEGLGQAVASFTPPANFASVMAGIGPGVEARREVANIVRNDLLKREQSWMKDGLKENEAIATAREKIADIRKDVEKLQKDIGVDKALPMGVIAKPAAELSRSVEEIEDPTLKREARKTIRQLDPSPESALRQGLDNMVKALEKAENDLDAIIYREDGITPKPPIEWSDADIAKNHKMRDEAAEVLGKALTQTLTTIVKTPEGKEVTESILAQGLVTKTGEIKEALAETIASTIMNSVIDSDLFSQGSLAGIGRIIAADSAIDPSVLGKDYASKAAQFREQANQMTRTVFEPDPVTGEDKPRVIDVGKKDRDLLIAKAERFERLAVIFASPEAAEGVVLVAGRENVIHYRDLIDTAAAKGEVAPAIYQAVVTAGATHTTGDAVFKISESVYKTIVGEHAQPEYVAAMASPKNKDLGTILNGKIARLKAALDILKNYIGQEGQTRVAKGNATLKEVTDAIENVQNLTVECQRAQNDVNRALTEPSAAKRRAKIVKVMKQIWEKGISPVVEFGKKNSIAAVIGILLMGPLVFGILWVPVQAVAWAFGKDVGNPIIWFSDAVEIFLGIFRSKRNGDQEASRGGGKGGGGGGDNAFFWTALGISMIFFGKQLFPVVGEALKLFGAGLKTFHDLIPWAKKKKGGKRGRPSEGGEKKLKGAGRPVDIDEAKEDLERAREEGDEAAEQRIINKLKKAAERGQSVPPGLWGYYWR